MLEGPPDAQDLLSWVAHQDVKPPVAILVYPADEPRRAVYFPLAVFSPEWQTLQWAASNAVPVRFMDLPQSNQLALEKAGEDQAATAEESDGEEPEDEQNSSPDAPRWRVDPLAIMAEAAGYQDHELWWEDQVERRCDASQLFAAIHEAMTAVRAEFPEVQPRDLLREAHMRKTLRAVTKEGFQNVAVVCGAWHVPVLDAEALAGKRPGCKIKEDTERLSGLPKLKTTATLIPWTYSRLTYRSGYGAGVQSPGWYAHIWNSNDEAPTRWLATAARLLRAETWTPPPPASSRLAGWPRRWRPCARFARRVCPSWAKRSSPYSVTVNRRR